MTPDIFGLSPVYENSQGERGSDPRRLTRANTIDEAALAGYLLFSHVPTPKTIYTDVKRVMPPVPVSFSASDNGGTDVLTLLRRAVQKRLPKENSPVGVYLSGGLDSSLIAALLVEAGVKVIGFTLDFGVPKDGELAFAEQVASHLKIPLRRVLCGPKEVARAWEPTMSALPQPYGDAVTVPLYLLGLVARQEVSIVFNGEGGDQLFGGWVNKPLVAAIAYGEQNLYTSYRTTYHRFDGRLSSLWPTHPPLSVEDWLAVGLEVTPEAPLIHRLRAANIALKGAQNIAPRCVALGSCHGLRIEAPFFDEALTEYTFQLPPEAFLSGACEKAILKEAGRSLLPDEILYREKRGMGVPSADWCLPRFGPVGRRVRSLLGSRRIKRERRFDPAFIKGLLAGYDPTPAGFRRRRVGEKLWTLATWELWRDVHAL
ncbi:MAG: asparagine synthase C-terminal domain-containing protein [Armatimonas sp.]